EAVTVDFGAVAERYIHVRLYGSSADCYHRIYTSSNGSTWTLWITTNTSSATSFFIKDTIRYIRITVQNATTTVSVISYICEVNGFATSSAFFTRTVSYTDKVVIDEIQVNPYWIWVDPSPSLTVSVFERASPSSATEVWIL
ncbi:MAG: hypothetical protein QW584_04000, partial [Thermofilaceae archaeon]